MAFSLVFYCSLFKLYIITHIIFVNLFNNFHTFIIKFVYYNTKYTVSVGGTAKGEAKDGLYSDGNYSGGTEVGSETTSNTITNITQEGASTNSMRGQGGQGGRPGGKGHKMQLNTNGQTNNQINS